MRQQMTTLLLFAITIALFFYFIHFCIKNDDSVQLKVLENENKKLERHIDSLRMQNEMADSLLRERYRIIDSLDNELVTNKNKHKHENTTMYREIDVIDSASNYHRLRFFADYLRERSAR
jgi:hypothetical protein